MKIVVVADLHFGHIRIDPAKMYDRLVKYLYPKLQDAHIVFLAGDIFDQLLTVNSSAVEYALQFIYDLARMSANTGMQVRILHGTFTHDRGQLRVFEKLKVPKSRIKIIDTIFTEKITDIRNGNDSTSIPLKVGYLPDNLSFKDSADAILQLQDNMSCSDIDKLDLIIAHGSFEHVLPKGSAHLPPCLYNKDQFKDILNGLCICGHIHTPSRSDNFIYAGSFDRMAHGEEERKGFVIAKRDLSKNNDSWDVKFITNDDSTKFISYTPEGTCQSDKINNFIKHMKELFPDGTGYIRVIDDDPEIRAILHRITLQQFPGINYTSKTTGERESIQIKLDDIEIDVFTDVIPNEENLPELVYNFLEENKLLDGLTKETIIEHTKEILEMK